MLPLVEAGFRVPWAIWISIANVTIQQDARRILFSKYVCIYIYIHCIYIYYIYNTYIYMRVYIWSGCLKAGDAAKSYCYWYFGMIWSPYRKSKRFEVVEVWARQVTMRPCVFLLLDLSSCERRRVAARDAQIHRDSEKTQSQNKSLPSGKLTSCYGKSPSFKFGKSTIDGPFSIATLNYQRVTYA